MNICYNPLFNNISYELEVCFLVYTDTYERARSKLRSAEITSDLTTEQSTDEHGGSRQSTRKRMGNSRYVDSESSDEELVNKRQCERHVNAKARILSLSAPPPVPAGLLQEQHIPAVRSHFH